MFLLQVMYKYVRKIFVTITLFSLLLQRFDGKAWFFIIMSSLEIVHDTVQYRYCIFLLLNRLLSFRLKRQNPQLSYVREREQVHCKMYNVVYSTLYFLFYLMLIMSYCG